MIGRLVDRHRDAEGAAPWRAPTIPLPPQRHYQIPDPAGVNGEPVAEIGRGRAAQVWEEHDLDQHHVASQ
jgi:hypothetical protein